MDASTTGAKSASMFGQRKLYNPGVRSDYNNKHRSTKTDPLPGGLSFFEGQADTLIKWLDSSKGTRRLSVSGLAELPIPETAVVGETEMRAPAYVRLGVWKDDGGWLLFSWNAAQEATKAEHEELVQRSEGSLEALRWLPGCRALQYWTTKGQHSHVQINLYQEAMDALEKAEPELPAHLQPRRHACSYRIQGSLCQLWLPL